MVKGDNEDCDKELGKREIYRGVWEGYIRRERRLEGKSVLRIWGLQNLDKMID